MKTEDKVSIGSCDPGTVNSDFAYMLIFLAQSRNEKLGPFIRVKGSGLLSKMRNDVVKHFLDKTNSEWLLMIDSDERLTATVFDKLVETAHHIERPVVSGLVFSAFENGGMYPSPIPSIFKESPEGFHPLSYYPQDSIFPIDACGAGCLLIHRSVLEKMRELATPNQGKDWCWFWDGPINGNWVGEDLLFSRRVRELGFPIYVNTGAILPHQKTYWLDERHHIEIYGSQPKLESGRTQDLDVSSQ